MIKYITFLASILVLENPLNSFGQTTTRWWPASGTVILGGGHQSDETSKEFAKRLITLAGGPESVIVIIPTANPKADTVELKHWLESYGAHHVVILDTRSKQVANTESFAKILRSANAVFVTGGQSLILENTYRGTLVEKELKALLARGGVIAGDSAGAVAIGCMWLTWLPDPYGKRSDGLCLIPSIAVSPHADVAKGYTVDEEVLKYLVLHPEVTGIDIDENTMIILNQGNADVIGKGHVSILDATKNKNKPVMNLTAGKYSLNQ